MSLSLVLEALREPESFARRWALERRAPFTLLASLAATASVGVGAYGAAMHVSQDALAAGQGGAAAILAADAEEAFATGADYVDVDLIGGEVQLLECSSHCLLHRLSAHFHHSHAHCRLQNH